MGVRPNKRHSYMQMMHMNIGGLFFLIGSISIFKNYFVQRRRRNGVTIFMVTMASVSRGGLRDFIKTNCATLKVKSNHASKVTKLLKI